MFRRTGHVALDHLPDESDPKTLTLGVPGVHVQRFREFTDLRGSLTAGELPSDEVPFVPKRWFMVYDVPSREVRGEHAHRDLPSVLWYVCPVASTSQWTTDRIEAR